MTLAPEAPRPEEKVKTDSTTVERTPWYRRKSTFAIGGVAAGAALTAGALFGVNTANQAPKTEPVAEAPIDSGDQDSSADNTASVETVDPIKAPETTFDVTTIPEDVVTGNLFETLTDEERSEISEMDSMNLESFRQLPQSEQLVFGEFVRANNIGILEYRLQQTGNTQYFEAANLETPEGIFATNQLNYFLLASLKTRTEADGIQFDALTAKKASAIIIDHTKDTIGSQGIDDLISSWNVNTPPVLNPSVLKSTKIDEEGNIVANTVDSYGADIQTTIKLVEGLDIKDQSFTTTEQLLSVSAADPRYRNSLAE